MHVASPRSARIETQGIADDAPFAFELTGRRIGLCDTPPDRVAGR